MSNHTTIFTCPSCGFVSHPKGDKQIRCPHCGVFFHASLTDHAMYADLLYAVKERQEGHFDTAGQRYRELMEQYGNTDLMEAVYWGHFLCEQGVIFYRDAEGRTLPSFGYISDQKCSKSLSYKKAMAYGAKSGNCGYYEALAELIEEYKSRYRKASKEISGGYDLFICFNPADAENTQLGYEIDKGLGKDYVIFFAPESLRRVPCDYHEPYLYHALSTAGAMIVLCSDGELLDASWMRNQWQRFQRLAEGTNRTILLVFQNGFSAKDLPDELKECERYSPSPRLLSRLKPQLETILSEEQSGNASAVVAITPPQKKKSHKKRLIGILAILVAVGVTIGLWQGLGKPAQGNTPTTGTETGTETETEPSTTREKETETEFSTTIEIETEIETETTIETEVETTIKHVHDVQNGTCLTCGEVLWTAGLMFIADSTAKTATVTGYTGSSHNIIIPSEYEGYPVTNIANGAFLDNHIVEHVTLPDSIKSIGQDAFSECLYLESVSLGDGVTDIGEKAFYHCINLVDLTIGNSVTHIRKFAFASCWRLATLTIPDNVISIGEGAFSDCIDLLNVSIENGVTSIGDYAFDGCTDLTHVTIPDSITSIGSFAFNDCRSLTKITIGNGVTHIGSSAFRDCSGLAHVSIGNSVTHIGSHAFYCCSSLARVSFGNSVTHIDDYAFSNCALTHMTIPDSVISIGSYVFSKCPNLTTVTIPDSVTSMGNYVFRSCPALTNVIFEATDSWWVSQSSTATGGTLVPSTDLADPSIATTYLKSIYSRYYWKRS